MEKKEAFPIRILFAILGVHVLTSLIFILVSNITHPLYSVLASFPLLVQVLVVVVFSFVLYILPGYLFIIGLEDKSRLIKFIDKLMTMFALILLIGFVISFVYTLVLHSKQGWLIYATLNPMSGLLIYNLFNKMASWWDIVWSFTVFAPPLGMMFGMYLRLKKEGAVR